MSAATLDNPAPHGTIDPTLVPALDDAEPPGGTVVHRFAGRLASRLARLIRPIPRLARHVFHHSTWAARWIIDHLIAWLAVEVWPARSGALILVTSTRPPACPRCGRAMVPPQVIPDDHPCLIGLGPVPQHSCPACQRRGRRGLFVGCKIKAAAADDWAAQIGE